MKLGRKGIRNAILFAMVIILISGMGLHTEAASTLYWPVPGHTNYGGFHAGNAIDITDGSIGGATVIAAMGGTVTHKFLCGQQHYGSGGDCYGFGTGIVIAGDDGRTYQYAHMQANSIPSNVYYGAYVTAGQKIGQVGTTGNSSGNHLHFGISWGNYWNESGINPANESYNYSGGIWYQPLPIANYGQSFYAHIVKTDVWRHIGKVNNNVELVQGENIADGSDLWYFQRQSDGSYAILNCYNYNYTSNALEVNGSGQANGTNIGTASYHGGTNQRWFLHGYQNGQYYFRPAYTDKVMDLADNNNNYGTNIWLWQHNGSVAQQYGIYIIEPPSSATVSVTPGTSTGKTVINWTKTANTNKYTVVIKRVLNGQVYSYKTISGVRDNKYSIQLPKGDYQIYVNSLNEATYVKSNTVAVSVKSGMKQFKVKLGTTSYTYSGKAKKPTVYVYVDGKKISKSYYTVSYKNNVQAGTAAVSVKGKGKYSNYEGSTTFTIKPKNFTVKLKYSSYAYTGSQRKPSISVYNGRTKVSSKYYTVTYSDNINIGTGTITLTGKGKYASFQGKKTFTIKPAKQEILSITSPSRNRIDVIYRQDNQASGYQAQMCLYKSFKKGMLQYKGTSTAVTGTGLRSGKKYYFRVRSYKVVNGKTIYGSWSNIRSIRAK